jgi:hypothetical protein
MFRIFSSVLAISLFLASARTPASPIAYTVFDNGNFGTVDLGSGAFTNRGSLSQILGGLASLNGNLYAISLSSPPKLLKVNPDTQQLLVVGTLTPQTLALGSTTTSLYTLSGTFGSNIVLNQINPNSAAIVSSINVGIPLDSFSWGISTNSAVVYIANGVNVYKTNPGTGITTFVTSTAGANLGAMTLGGTTLYGADANTQNIDSIDTTTGAFSVGPAVTGSGIGLINGLAPVAVALPAGSSSDAPIPIWAVALLGVGLVGVASRRLHVAS